MSSYDYQPVNKWKVGGLIAAGILVVGGVSVGIYAATASTSGVRGAVALHNQNNTAENRVAAEGQWNIAYKDVQRDISNLAAIKQTYKASDPQGFIITAQESCNDAVNTYNQLDKNPLTKGWKPATLPLEYDANTCN